MSLPGTYHGHGIELRPEHYPDILREVPDVDWIEVLTERFLHVSGGIRFEVLEKLRSEVSISLHGTTLSIGSVDPLNDGYVRDLKELADRVEPAWISDHLAWSSYGGADLVDLFPLPYTEEALDHVVERVLAVQEFLGRQILLENPSSYLAFSDSRLQEWEFLAAVAERADCGILLDVNNVYVTALNQGFEASDYLAGLPAARIREIHLAGHDAMEDLLIDTHEGPVPGCVWDLYRESLRRFGRASTIVEWDTATPELAVLVGESRRAAAIEREVGDEAR
jgi:hypothetical protein